MFVAVTMHVNFFFVLISFFQFLLLLPHQFKVLKIGLSVLSYGRDNKKNIIFILLIKCEILHKGSIPWNAKKSDHLMTSFGVKIDGWKNYFVLINFYVFIFPNLFNRSEMVLDFLRFLELKWKNNIYIFTIYFRRERRNANNLYAHNVNSTNWQRPQHWDDVV